MKVFKNFKIGAKIMGGYLLVLVLLVVVGVVAIVRLQHINHTVVEMADHLDADQLLAQNIESNLEEARLYAVRYMHKEKPDDLQRHRDAMAKLKTLLSKADADADHLAGTGTLQDFRTGVEKYEQTFEQVSTLMAERNRLMLEEISVQGDLAEQKLEPLRKQLHNNKNDAAVYYVDNAEEAILLLRLDAYRYLDTGDEQWFERANTDYNAVNTAFDTLNKELSDPVERASVAESLAAAKAFYQSTINLQKTMVAQESLVDEQNAVGDTLLQKVRNMVQSTEQAFNQAKTESVTITSQTIQLVVILVVVAVILGLVIGIASSQGIAKALRVVTQVAQELEKGSLNVDLTRVNSRDEIGTLSRAFESMVGSLQSITDTAQKVAQGDLTVAITPRSEQDALGHALQQMLASLRTQVKELAESVTVLTSSASQILATSAELATSASQTASAVNETTATITEVRQTTEISTQKANLVAQQAQKNAEISHNGLRATEDTITAMKHIDAKISSIADSIVMLSEQSQTISSIISAVDDLAEQSNLLAVNAAIEAAKAGEQGKGFTVVAQEIKSLAEQSRQFTVQVQTILNDIQKATSKAVMTTEEGSKAVTKGVRQSTDVGAAIKQLTEHIEQGAQAAMQIAASSQQQLVGVDQVVTAMESINQASNQNVEGARQLEAAVQNLETLGHRLQKFVTRYQI